MSVAESPATVMDYLREGARLHRAHDLVGAAEQYNEVLRLEPEHPDALHLVGLLASQRGYPKMALDWVSKSLEVRPDFGPVHGTLGLAFAAVGNRIGALAEFRRAVALDPYMREAWDNLIFASDLDPNLTREETLALRREYNRRFIRPLMDQASPHTNDRSPMRKLRVGYVSADFKMHSCAYSAWPLISRHDHDRFEVHLFDNGQKPDVVTARFWQTVDHAHHIANMGDEEAAAYIREQQIDVLVDLSGFSGRNRLLLFARRPAPIQITAIGYLPDTTGLDCFNGIVVDDALLYEPYLSEFTEQPLRCSSALPYQPLIEMPEVGPPPVDRNGYVTFGYLGRPYKLNDQVMAAWAAILKRVPTARLLLKSNPYDDEECVHSVVDPLVALGVEDERIEVRGGTNPYEHAAAYNDVDICLDSFPQTGGMTNLESLYMGVPFVTLQGRRIQERLGYSMLQAIETDRETVASSVKGYVAKAVACARNVTTVSTWRPYLRDDLKASRYMQHQSTTRALEEHMVRLFTQWAQDGPA